MPDRPMIANILNYLLTVEKRRPAVVSFAAGLLAGSVMIGAVLLQGRETETALQPNLTYQQCAGVQNHANRLACYDDVTNQTFPLAVKNSSRMNFGELLGALRSNQARGASANQR
jgi:hypothetical protein